MITTTNNLTKNDDHNRIHAPLGRLGQELLRVETVLWLNLDAGHQGQQAAVAVVRQQALRADLGCRGRSGGVPSESGKNKGSKGVKQSKTDAHMRAKRVRSASKTNIHTLRQPC